MLAIRCMNNEALSKGNTRTGIICLADTPIPQTGHSQGGPETAVSRIDHPFFLILRTPDSGTVFLPAGGFSLPFLAGSDHWGDGCRDRFCQARLPSPVSSILRGHFLFFMTVDSYASIG